MVVARQVAGKLLKVIPTAILLKDQRADGCYVGGSIRIDGRQGDIMVGFKSLVDKGDKSGPVVVDIHGGHSFFCYFFRPAIPRHFEK